MTEIWRLSAVDLAALIRSREVSARKAAQAALDRLDAVNARLNAVVAHRPAEVLARADEIDAQIARGEDPGVLAGVPVTVKCNVDQAGYATTNGVRLQRDLIAATNSPVVDNLLRSGAVILGRSRPGSGISRMGRTSAGRSAIRPTRAACMACVRPSGASRRSTHPRPSGGSGRR